MDLALKATLRSRLWVELSAANTSMINEHGSNPSIKVRIG
jgi:hypothetical protein